MSTLIDGILSEYSRLNFEPIDVFISRINRINNIEELAKIGSNLDALQKDITIRANVSRYNWDTWNYDTKGALIKVEWRADYYKVGTINANFSTKDASSRNEFWKIAFVLDFLRSLEFYIATKRFPNILKLRQSSQDVIKLNQDTQGNFELKFPGIYGARVLYSEDIISFIIGLSLDARRALIKARINELGYS